MSEIEKVKRYIDRTNIPREISVRYDVHMEDLLAILRSKKHPIEAIYLVFEYGKARGYRAAKAEVRR